MSWHHPDPYFFLCLAGSLAAFLAPSIIDELTSTIDELLGRRRKPPAVEPRRSTVNEKAVDPPSPPKHPPSLRKYLKKARPLDGLQRDRPRPTEERHEIDESSRQAGKQAAERARSAKRDPA